MKRIIYKFFIITLAMLSFSCSDGENGIDGTNGEDGIDGIDGFDVGLEYVVFAGDITNEEAAEIAQQNFGKNTHSILVINTTNLTVLDLTEVSNLIKLEVTGNKSLQSLSLPNLESIIEDVSVENNETLTTINFENLLTVPSIIFENNAVLNTINLNNLINSNRLELDENELLETLSLPALKEIGSLRLRPSKNLTTLDLPNLEVLRSLSISDTKLSEINLPSVETLNFLTIQENEDLQTVTIPLLANTQEDGAGITIRSNIALRTVSLGSINKFGRLRIENNENLTLFEANSIQEITNTFSLRNNTNLTSLSFPGLLRILSLDINESNLTEINFDVLQEATRVQIRENENLSTISLPSLTFTEGIQISENNALTNIRFDGLQNTDASITISANENLNTISFASLATLNGNLGIISNNSLENIRFPQLTLLGVSDIRTVLTISNNSMLNNMDFSNLTTLNSGVTITGNGAITSLAFPSLTTVTGFNTSTDIRINSNHSLTNIDFQNLEMITNIRRIVITEELLTDVNFMNLASFSELNIDSNSLITSLDLSSVQDFSSMRLGNSGRLSTTTIDRIFARLVNVTPALTGKSITARGEASTQALEHAQTLRDNGNNVSLSN
ncbi:hypothetical protein [Aquimarina spongiae]|uniref:Receptor L domain-containing protein n=1 Tax=Aquimarina spongiae TaxID=570521 RepID=A0A1M6JNT8_9FLAO|nr:hypothetical protein [Aquimarina spongiae]SHJ48367.1 hypothetical protein SAMN04488508_109165 [Aquimarina spongiae]